MSDGGWKQSKDCETLAAWHRINADSPEPTGCGKRAGGPRGFERRAAKSRATS